MPLTRAEVARELARVRDLILQRENAGIARCGARDKIICDARLVARDSGPPSSVGTFVLTAEILDLCVEALLEAVPARDGVGQ